MKFVVHDAYNVLLQSNDDEQRIKRSRNGVQVQEDVQTVFSRHKYWNIVGIIDSHRKVYNNGKRMLTETIF